MKYAMTLEYTLAPGWLRPWVDGLRQGKAMASACSGCDRTQFPPLRICPTCEARSDGWKELSGVAHILYRTSGSDGDFAMVRFDGADGAAIVRTDRLCRDETTGRLIPVPEGPPVMGLGPETRA